MAATFQNSAMVLSIGLFFTLMVLGIAADLPSHLYAGLVGEGVPAAQASKLAHLPPVGTLFAAFLGDNPMGVLLGPTLHHLSHARAAVLTGRQFFPSLIKVPFRAGLQRAFDFAALACFVAAAASLLSGEKFVHDVSTEPVAPNAEASVAGEPAFVPVKEPAALRVPGSKDVEAAG